MSLLLPRPLLFPFLLLTFHLNLICATSISTTTPTPASSFNKPFVAVYVPKACRNVTCAKCYHCQVNFQSKGKCVFEGNCCANNEHGVNCLRDPCQSFRDDCSQATSCVSDYCTGCDAVYYDDLLDQIPLEQCKKSSSPPTYSTTTEISSNSGNNQPTSCAAMLCATNNECRVVNGQAECLAIDPRPQQCFQPMDAGPCQAIIPVFFYDSQSKTCKTFNYGGCKGTDNRFDTQGECETTCMPRKLDAFVAPITKSESSTNATFDLKSCSLPRETGKCRGAFLKYGYNAVVGTCHTFTYGGCGGNDNRFDSSADCLAACSSVRCPVVSLASPPAGCEYVNEPHGIFGCVLPVLSCTGGVCGSQPCTHCQHCRLDGSNVQKYSCVDKQSCTSSASVGGYSKRPTTPSSSSSSRSTLRSSQRQQQ